MASTSASSSGGGGDEMVAAALDHATSWFLYHAGQRIQSFNFFVVIQAGLALALFQSGWTNDAQGIAISIAGLLVSVAFYCLEVRNATLVNDGRRALIALEAAIRSGTGLNRSSEVFPLDQDGRRKPDPGRWLPVPRALFSSMSEEADSNRPRYATHTFVFRVLLGLAAASWIGSLLRSVLRS